MGTAPQRRLGRQGKVGLSPDHPTRRAQGGGTHEGLPLAADRPSCCGVEPRVAVWTGHLAGCCGNVPQFRANWARTSISAMILLDGASRMPEHGAFLPNPSLSITTDSFCHVPESLCRSDDSQLRIPALLGKGLVRSEFAEERDRTPFLSSFPWLDRWVVASAVQW